MSQRGSILKRGDTWTAYWSVRGPEGQRVQKTKGGFRTKREASSYLTEILGAVHAGTWSEPQKITVAKFLTDHWLPTVDKRSTTTASYRTTAEKWIIPHVGGILLPQLTPKDVERMVDELRRFGNRKGEPLSPRSVQYALTVLRMALKHAVAHGMILRNPAAAVARPQAPRSEMKCWTAEQASAFLSGTSDDRLAAAWLLFLTRGFRRGELAGLRWADVDLDGGRISVVHTRVMVNAKAEASQPKTARGRRTVPLDPDLVSALRTHRRRQLEERLAWGEAYQDSGYVFTREDGDPLVPEYLSTAFEKRVKKLGLPMIRLHDTRHTAATLALQAGIPTEVVSKWLGHSSVGITQDVYQHVAPTMLEEAGAKLTAIVLGARADSAF